MVRKRTEAIQVGIRLPAKVVRWSDTQGENLLLPAERDDIRLGRQGLRQAVIRELLERAMAQG